MVVHWKMSADEARRRLAIIESALRNPDVRNRAQLLEVKAKLEMKLELMAMDDRPPATAPKLAEKQSTPITSECAPPGVTIH